MAPSTADYESQRQENIRKNQELLSRLNLKALGGSVGAKKRTASDASVGSAKKARAKNPPKPKEKTAPTTRRTSSRLSSSKQTAEELEKQRQDEERKEEEEQLERQRRKHMDKPLVAEAWRVKDDEEALTKGLFEACANLGQGPDGIKADTQTAPSSPSQKEYASLRKSLEALSLRAFSKVTPNRIYCSTFHPTTSKSLIFVGDKLGAIGVWDASATPASAAVKPDPQDEDTDVKVGSIKESSPSAVAGDGDDGTAGDESTNEGNAFVIQAHARNSVSSIRMDPNNPHQLFTAAYDCTIRLLNFETRTNVEVVDGDRLDDSQDVLFSAIDFANEGRELWASDNQGGLTLRDLREPKAAARRWQVSDKKVGCVSLCPAAPRYAATAHLNREMRLWDLRRLVQTPPDAAAAAAAGLGRYTHGLACSSAYFDPTGTRLLSTSYDDTVRVWCVPHADRGEFGEEEGWEPSCKISHDNQVGRWVSVFKAQWCGDVSVPAHFTIGNMTRKVDIYAPTGDLVTSLQDDELTTVPAVTMQHPTDAFRIAGCTGGGKVYLWSRE